MNTSRNIAALRNCHPQSRQRELAVWIPAQSPTNTTSAEQVHYHCDINELTNKPNIRDICDPRLICSCNRQIFNEIWIFRKSMIGLRCYWLRLLSLYEEIILFHYA